ncbi:MAG: hypothetical protein R3B96_22150 [Pirellulaceae bacterium]
MAASLESIVSSLQETPARWKTENVDDLGDRHPWLDQVRQAQWHYLTAWSQKLLCLGVVDAFQGEGLRVLVPPSKRLSSRVPRSLQGPAPPSDRPLSAEYRTFTDAESAEHYIQDRYLIRSKTVRWW